MTTGTQGAVCRACLTEVGREEREGGREEGKRGREEGGRREERGGVFTHIIIICMLSTCWVYTQYLRTRQGCMHISKAGQ